MHWRRENVQPCAACLCRFSTPYSLANGVTLSRPSPEHSRMTDPDLSVQVGRLSLANPIMPASGTFGQGAEFADYGDLSELGAIVVKSLSAHPWAGNAAPRVLPLDEPDSMINAVGLPNPGVLRWSASHLPALLRLGARVVASVWGHTAEEFIEAATLLAAVEGPIAWEINLSCPNLNRANELFAHNVVLLRQLLLELRSVAGPGRQMWAKLSPAVPDIVAIAAAAAEGSADAVTIANTIPGMLVDIERRQPALANGYGGVSGRIIHPVIVSLVYQVHMAIPSLPVVAAGGVFSGVDAIEFLMAGASAVQVGTANFADPRATHRVLNELREWCRLHETNPRDLIGAAQSPIR